MYSVHTSSFQHAWKFVQHNVGHISCIQLHKYSCHFDKLHLFESSTIVCHGGPLSLPLYPIWDNTCTCFTWALFPNYGLRYNSRFLTVAETKRSLKFFGRRLPKTTLDSKSILVEGAAKRSQLSLMTPLNLYKLGEP